MSCSGIFYMKILSISQALGPSVTRVRSSKRDTWTTEFVEIMDKIGNKLANEYFEYKIPSNYQGITQNMT